MAVRRRWAWGLGIAAVLVALGAGGMLALDHPAVQAMITRAAVRRAIAHAAAQRALVEQKELRVVLCGTASPLPNRERAGPCAAILAGGKIFLVDVGGGGVRNLQLWQLPTDHIAGVFLTHFHSDHIEDLGEVNLQSWGQGRPGPLPVYGGPGVETVVSGFLAAYSQDEDYRIAHHGSALMVPDNFAMVPTVIAHPGGTALAEGETQKVFERDGLTVTAIGVNHSPVKPAYGYRFDYAGRSVVISGDTKASPGLAAAAKGTDILVHEAQAQALLAVIHDEMAAAGNARLAKIFADIPSYHTAPIEAAGIANQAGAKLLVLTHLTPPMPGWLAAHVFLAGVDAVRPTGTLVGHDGLMVSLPPDLTAVEVTDLD
jgi:ribonuclease Z